MSTLYTALTLALVCLLLSWPGLRRAATRRYVLGSALVIFAFVVAVKSDSAALLAWLPALANQGDWSAALLVLFVGALAVAVLMARAGWQREEFGLRLTFSPGTWTDLMRFLLPLLLLEAGVLWGLVPAGHPSLAGHLFQLLAPGISEELVFRGVLLALLNRAFPGRVRVLKAELGWGAVVSSLVFGLCHGLRVGADWHVTVPLGPMLIPTAGGLVLAWCRARSGSLLLPIAVHGGMNELAQVIAFIKARSQA